MNLEKAEVRIEEIESFKQLNFQDEHPEVIIREMDSDRTLRCLKGVTPSVEKIDEITHYRISEQAEYITFIKTKHYTIQVISGLTSGYLGKGVRIFNQYLLDLGLSEEKANIVYDTSFRDAVIKIQ